MKRLFCKWLCCAVTLLPAHLTLYPQIFAQGFSPATENRLQQVFDSFQYNSTPVFVGEMEVVINVDGLAKWRGTTSLAARTTHEQNNLLRGENQFTGFSISGLCAMTTTFTAALVLELAEARLVDPDAPLSDYFPMNIVNPQLVPSVTLRQLLAHESGFSDYTTEPALQVAVAVDPKHQWNLYEALPFVKQVNPPGLARRYSSTNYMILGAIIENVTGRKLGQLLRERFFDPLKLKSMDLVAQTLQQGAAPHDDFKLLHPSLKMSSPPAFPNTHNNITRLRMNALVSLAFAGGAITSDADDLSEWGNALFGGRATTASTTETMLNSLSSLPDRNGNHLGYGLWSNHKISSTDYFIGHEESVAGYSSLMMYQPDRKMTIAVITNASGIDPYVIAQKLYEVLPLFSCGNANSKGDKLMLSKDGRDLCVPRNAAAVHIGNGAFLGSTQANGRPDLPLSANRKMREKLSDIVNLNVFPNPMRTHATISFIAPISGLTSVTLFEMQGRTTQSIFAGVLQKGERKQLSIQPAGLPAGSYTCRLQTAAGIISNQFVVSR
ncbi:T9SS type A sorting domain-containing protein [Segetibacter sp. 3557_3]|uniref:serine hydrolase n=1 Tax=Segetibacter sp. 3557_3 TaxID=2547429 RepID=UPI00105870B4|nr:serine hydrolase [Segetibacter sp. 3557_3]TDH27033.1 T9SS type A sorting domain-containing protein [Segetibacter sp. 3557_3]